MSAPRSASEVLVKLCEEFRLKLVRIRQIAVLALLAAAPTACAPVIETHGYFARGGTLAKPLEEGSHSRQEIEELLGSPSTVAAFDENLWYYISSTSHTFAWKPPIVVARSVMAIQFDAETNMVKSVRTYDVKDGRVIAFASDVTPTRGREFSFFEQLLGNVGRISADDFDEDDRNRRR